MSEPTPNKDQPSPERPNQSHRAKQFRTFQPRKVNSQGDVEKLLPLGTPEKNRKLIVRCIIGAGVLVMGAIGFFKDGRKTPETEWPIVTSSSVQEQKEFQLTAYRDAHPFLQMSFSGEPHLEYFFDGYRKYFEPKEVCSVGAAKPIPGAIVKRDDPLDHFYALEEDQQTEVIFACEVMLQYLEKIANQEIRSAKELATRQEYVKDQYGRCELFQIYCRDQAQNRNLKLLKLVQ